MRDRCEEHDGDERENGVSVVVHGAVARRPRCISTVEGWEVASLVLGPGDVGVGVPEGGAVLVVCSGVGSAGAVTRLAAGEEVIVLGRLVPRRAARPEHDVIELVADAVLARRRAGEVTTATEPRIAP
ncbi:hypothetical protein JOE38_000448 [Clavibacter michiganensis]|uniref:hypothetical protein n=1 Tax=Clavibacter michiganensis TaxID=28447 RepID=UPI00195E7E5F|nr:hypothetical protein [Clavibacter michiganensis]MBM7410625.1 hypothetical protein [Clavibacter michiganensis]